MNLLIFGGGAALLLYLMSQSGNGGSSQPSAFVETVVLDGTNGDDYNMKIDAVTAKVSPYDKDSVFVYHNTSQGSADPQVQADLNASAKEAGIKNITHVYGPSDAGVAARHYSEGVLVEEVPQNAGIEGVKSWLEGKSVGGVGRTVIASTGRKVLASAGATHHMAAMGATGAEGHLEVIDMSHPTPAFRDSRKRKAVAPDALKRGLRTEMRRGRDMATASRVAKQNLHRNPRHYG